MHQALGGYDRKAPPASNIQDKRLCLTHRKHAWKEACFETLHTQQKERNKNKVSGPHTREPRGDFPLNETPVPACAHVPLTITACCTRLPPLPVPLTLTCTQSLPQLLSLVSLRLSSPLCATPLPPCPPSPHALLLPPVPSGLWLFVRGGR